MMVVVMMVLVVCMAGVDKSMVVVGILMLVGQGGTL